MKALKDKGRHWYGYIALDTFSTPPQKTIPQLRASKPHLARTSSPKGLRCQRGDRKTAVWVSESEWFGFGKYGPLGATFWRKEGAFRSLGDL